MALDAARDVRPTILVVNSCERLGDTVTRLAAYRAMRLVWPDHRIVTVASEFSVFESALSAASAIFVDKVITRELRILSIAGFKAVMDEVGGVERIFDFRNRRDVIAGYMGSKGRVTSYIPNIPGFWPRQGVGGPPERRPDHNYRRYHRMVEIVAGRRLPFDASLPLSPALETEALRRLPDGPYLGLIIGETTSPKAWPGERWAALARAASGMGLRPVFLLGPAERDERTWIEAELPDAVVIGPAEAGDDSNALPWLLLAAGGRLAAVVAVEGGLGHLLATRGVPIATLSGPSKAVKWKPVTDAWWNVSARRYGSRDMSAIPVDAVVDTVAEMMRWVAARA